MGAALVGPALASCSGPKNASGDPPPTPVAVSAPLVRDLDNAQGYVGQFAALNQVELRAQVGGTLREIAFKDGAIVRKGDLLFVIDPVPYQLRLAQTSADLEAALARLDLANRELARAQELKRGEAGTGQNVDQRVSEQKAAQAAVDSARAQVGDARFDLDHCRITAPFTGRIGSHQVSVGNLVSGSRAGSSPTTLLATLVSLDPIYLNFDMSESDYLAYSRLGAGRSGPVAGAVKVQLSDETSYARSGTLDFVDNALDRSSGTIHARATVANPGLLLTPGEFGRVRLALGAPAPTLLLPDPVILPDQANHIVMVVGPNNVVSAKNVEIGGLRGGLRVIRSGLSAADQVIVEGGALVAPGSKVAPHRGVIRFAADQGGD